MRQRFPVESRVKGLSTVSFSYFLKKLNRMIPKVAISPIASFLCVNFNLESLTLEKKTPTIITESKLQDFAITTAGNDAQTTAWLQVNILRLIIPDITAHLFQGRTLFSFVIHTVICPIMQAINGGNIVNISDSLQQAYSPVSICLQGFFNLNNQICYNFSWQTAEMRQHEQMPAANSRNNDDFLKNQLIQISLRTVLQTIRVQQQSLQYQMGDRQQSDQMLVEIRNILTNSSESYTEEIESISDGQVKRYLEESYKMVQREDIDRRSPQLVYSKISEANVLLADESPMIKNYVRDKISSQVFGSKLVRSNSKQYMKLIEMREQLERKHLTQKIQYERNINEMIQSTRKYRKYENKKQIPLLEIEALINKEKLDYDKILKEEHRFKSSNNNYKNMEPVPVQTGRGGKGQVNSFQLLQKYNSSRKKKQQNYKEFRIQIKGQEEDQSLYLKNKVEITERRIENMLSQNRNFMRVFANFLQTQLIKIENDNKTQENQHINLQNTVSKPKRIYKFGKKLEGNDLERLENKNIINISQLSHHYKFKPFLMIKYDETDLKTTIIKRVINKRVGESNKYHTKQCIIEKNILYYTDQQQNPSSEIKKSNMKAIQISIAPLEILEEKKEEGGLFSGKQSQIFAVVMKGKQRNFTYELNFAEGVQLTTEINKVNLRRLHKMSCILRGSNNKNMEKFIQAQHTVLDLSQKYIRPQQEYPSKTYRSSFITLIMSLLPLRKGIQSLNLYKCKLSFNEINLILKECQRHLTSITEINMSNTKLDRETLKNVLNLIKKCPTTLSLNLSYCQLDDSILQANASNFTGVCSKIHNLNLEGNEITYKTVKGLKNIFSSKISQLKIIDISNCPIEEFGQLSSFIKSSNKLEELIANGCKISFTNFKQVEDLLLSTQNKSQLRKLQIRKNVFAGNIKWLEQIGPYLQIKIDLPIKLTSSNPLQSKFIRIQFINFK